jgi:hypothetical protein
MTEETPREIQRPPHYGEGPEERTELGEAGPSYEDFPSASDVGFDVDTETAPEVADMDAIPVVVVGMPGREPEQRIAWRAQTVTVGGVGASSERPVQLSGAGSPRTRLVLRNLNSAGSASVYLVPNSTTPPGDFGYELQPQDVLELYHSSAVWAVCVAGQTARVAVSAEHVLLDE